MTEDWDLLISFLPGNWRDLAAATGALKGLRKDKSADNLLRVLLIHLGCGHSLHETAVRARQTKLAELSAVAVWNRLKKSQVRILMNSNADSYPFRTLIPIFFERRFRSFLNSSERSNGAWNHHA